MCGYISFLEGTQQPRRNRIPEHHLNKSVSWLEIRRHTYLGDVQSGSIGIFYSIWIFTDPSHTHHGEILVYLPTVIRCSKFVCVKNTSHRLCPFPVGKNKPKNTIPTLHETSYYISIITIYIILHYYTLWIPLVISHNYGT